MHTILFMPHPVADRAKATLKNFRDLSKQLPQLNMRVQFFNGYKDKHAYWDALKSNWGRDDLITIEHDMVFGASDLLSLALCSHPDCCALYKLNPTSTKGNIAHTYAQGYYNNDLSVDFDSEGRECSHPSVRLLTREAMVDAVGKHCLHPSFGFTKISKEAQERVEFDNPIEWPHLDSWVFSRMYATFHMHGEVGHNH